MTTGLWIAWAVVTFAWNFINTENSRFKNSNSYTGNAVSTFAVSFLYLLSLLGIGNALLEARHDPRTLVFAAAAYAILSMIGSVAGQFVSINFLSRWENGHK
jgi:hypothetical protein